MDIQVLYMPIRYSIHVHTVHTSAYIALDIHTRVNIHIYNIISYIYSNIIYTDTIYIDWNNYERDSWQYLLNWVYSSVADILFYYTLEIFVFFYKHISWLKPSDRLNKCACHQLQASSKDLGLMTARGLNYSDRCTWPSSRPVSDWEHDVQNIMPIRYAYVSLSCRVMSHT